MAIFSIKGNKRMNINPGPNDQIIENIISDTSKNWLFSTGWINHLNQLCLSKEDVYKIQ